MATTAGPALIDLLRIMTTKMTPNIRTTDSEMATTAHTLKVGTPHPAWGSAYAATPPRPPIVPPTPVHEDPGDPSSASSSGKSCGGRDLCGSSPGAPGPAWTERERAPGPGSRGGASAPGG
ncbi:hypothetical protein GCM10009863_08140 [Streptomyces axinellae]|uniref:Uncharacterized protein n=1 Tax=Streptomyces axinellae TaxID=552788 RepID=A0ABN3PQ50_9ACTN